MTRLTNLPTRIVVASGLVLAAANLAPRSAHASDPVWGLLTALIRGVAPDEPPAASDDGAAADLTSGGDELRRIIADGIKLAQQPVQYQYQQPVQYQYQQPVQYQYQQPAQPAYAPRYVVPAPATGYQAVQNTVNAAVTYWTGQQPQAPQQPQAAPAAAPAQSAPAPAASGDAYGFTAWLNGIRAQYGLAPVAYDANLSAWANMNNAQQNSYGLGHHVMGPARRQNSAIGTAASIGAQWLASPPHAAALLDPSIRVIGIAGMGAFWTFNAY